MADIREGRIPTVPTVLRCCAALVATPPKLLRPRRPDTGLLASIEPAPLPPVRATVRLRVIPQATM
ncbi:hypothetical protein [Nocardia cyriacigeorgica]|nr:hypothetical protein [Nocardia cyriacigeorgica]